MTETIKTEQEVSYDGQRVTITVEVEKGASDDDELALLVDTLTDEALNTEHYRWDDQFNGPTVGNRVL